MILIGYKDTVEFRNSHEATVHLLWRKGSAYKTGRSTTNLCCMFRMVTCVWELLLVKGVTGGEVWEVKGKACGRRV